MRQPSRRVGCELSSSPQAGCGSLALQFAAQNIGVAEVRIIKNSKDIYYPAAPHGITAIHQDQVNADLLAFLHS